MYRIIIVEDEDIIREGLKETINWETMGFEVVGMAYDGYEGLKLVKSHRPDVVLTDIKMPEFDGLRLIEECKKLDPGIEIVFLSGYADFEYARQAVQHNAYDYILKMDLYTQLEPVFVRLREHLDSNKKNKMEMRQLKTVSEIQALVKAIRERDWKHLNISGKYFWVAVVGKGWSLIKDLEIFSLSKLNILIGEYSGNGIFLLCGDSEEHLKNSKNLFFSEVIKNFKKDTLLIGSGSIVREQGNVTNSYYEAMKMLDYGILEDRKGLCIYEYGKIDLVSFVLDEQWLGDKLAQLLLHGQNDEFIKYYKQFIKKAVCTREVTICNVRTHLLGVLSKLSTAYDSNEFEDRYSDYAASICRYDSILELSKWLEECMPEISGHINLYRMVNAGSMPAIISFVDKNFKTDIKMEDVAKYFFVSSPYFCTQFKKYTGMNFTSYVKMRRMELAYNIVSSTDISVSKVAKEVGYEDEKHFSKLFKEKYGISPAQCRMKKKPNADKETGAIALKEGAF